MDAAFFVRSLVYILPAVKVTLQLTVLALGLGLVFGMLLAVARVYGRPVARASALTYSRVVRSLPTLVIIFIVYFTVSVTFKVSEFASAVVALTVATTAYQSEIFRGAIQSLGTGQLQAARSLGMSQGVAILWVVIPQAVRLAIPSWSNEAAIVLKDSSLAYAVGVVEVLRRAQHIGAANHDRLTALTACAVIYFCLTFITNRTLDAAERRYRLRI
jgi:polar amino acid transport system permease protein